MDLELGSSLAHIVTTLSLARQHRTFLQILLELGSLAHTGTTLARQHRTSALMGLELGSSLTT